MVRLLIPCVRCLHTTPYQRIITGQWSGWWSGSRDDSPSTHLKWDQCVPSEINPDDNLESFE